MTPDEVEQLLKGIPEDEAPRLQILQRILAAIQELWESGSADLDLIVEKVGDGSRQEPWRIPYGESGILDFFIGILDTADLRPSLTVHTLRIIGNCCAEKNENRKRVVDSGVLPRIVLLLRNDSVLAFVVPVLFNICVDYEPAQTAAYKAGLNPELINLVSGPRLAASSNLMNYICKLLEFVAPQEPEPSCVHPATPFVLLSLAAGTTPSAELDDFLGQCTVALTYLTREQFQRTFLETPNALDTLFQAFEKACDGFELTELEIEEQAQLKQLQLVFTQALADISDHPLFNAHCPLDKAEGQTLRRWITHSCTPLQSAACLTLGNIARSEETCTQLVQATRIHEPLLAILADPATSEPQLLHSVLGLLKNLAMPAANKPILGAAGLLDPALLPRIWRLDTQPQVQFDAASLTRLLLLLCAPNVRLICAPLPATATTTAHDEASDPDSSTSPTSTTALHQLMDLHRRSDQVPIKMETARAVLSVCRVLHTTTPTTSSPPDNANATATSGPPAAADPDPEQQQQQDFYATHADDVLTAAQYLGTQARFPVLRAELWFALALMARSVSGGGRGVVVRAVNQAPIAAALAEAVTGESVPFDTLSSTPAIEPADVVAKAHEHEPEAVDIAQAMANLGGGGLEPRQVETSASASGAGKAAMDQASRENGLLLIAEVLGGGRADELSPATRSLFTRVLKRGGEMVLGAREEGEGSK
ncbi:armadillo-type protein [Whalleya microplaca]|nr:armadillo-type protein [Whalleya microplaca]